MKKLPKRIWEKWNKDGNEFLTKMDKDFEDAIDMAFFLGPPKKTE